MMKKEYHLSKNKKTKEELDNIYSLWQECFQDSSDYMDFYFKHIIPKNQVLSLYDENEIISMLHLNPYELSVMGKSLTVNYIVGVATKSSYRKRGLMRNLMEEAFHQMYQEKQSLTYLMPIAKEIYEPFDFSIVYEQEPWNYEMLKAPEMLKVANMQNDPLVQKAPLLLKAPLVLGEDKDTGLNRFIDIEVINSETIISFESMAQYKECLARFANEELSKEYNVYIPRNKEYYDILLDEVLCCGGGFLILKQEDKIFGYVAYMFDDMFHIVELICKDGYREKLIREINNIYLKVNKEKSDNINKFKTTIMMRIIHLEEFIKNVTSNEKISFIVEVEDNILVENNGVFLLEFDEDKGVIKRTGEKPQVKVNAKQLVELFFDRMNIEDMNSIVLAEDKNRIIKKLNKINKYNKVFINDIV